MLRRFALYATVAALSAAGAFPFLSPTFGGSSMRIAEGEFWRLPWTPGEDSKLRVTGNGYKQGSHTGSSTYALDFSVSGGIEGRYVVAVQEGTVIYAVSDRPDCCPQCGAGNYIDIRDVGGFVSHYAHLSSVYKNMGAYVAPGWIIGTAGWTGYCDPCASSNSHLHFRINKTDSCDDGNCIPEPMSDQCADWNYWYGIPISCGQMGDDYAFSSDPASQFAGWKSNWHISNNAGVGDYQYVDFQTNRQSDGQIQTRYIWENLGFGSYYVVGKPIALYGGGIPWVTRRNSWPFSGVSQVFLSPNDTYGLSAIMHGDGVDEDPAFGDSHAFWVYGDFYIYYLGECTDDEADGKFVDLLGYPTSERYWADGYLGLGWVQHFQNGAMTTTETNPFAPRVWFESNNHVCQNYLEAQGIPPEPTPTRTPRPTKTKTPTPLGPTNTPTITPTPTSTPTPTATPNIDTDGDGFLDHMDNCPLVANPDQVNADGDGAGDACDVCTSDPSDDADNDGVCAGSGYLPPKTGAKDNCANDYNPDQTNTDRTRRPNGSQIPGEWASNPKQDNMGDACDDDDDNDWWPDLIEYHIGCRFPPAPTDPLVQDTDGDRAVDGAECYLGSDPNNPNGKPTCSFGIIPDSDKDCLPDPLELAPYPLGFGSDRNNRDTDGDGIDDGIEVKGYGTSPASTDTDGDGCEDWIEIVDVTGNRQANTVDVLWVAKRANDIIPASDSDNVLDINKNGVVNTVDVLLAAQNSTLVRPHDPCSPE